MNGKSKIWNNSFHSSSNYLKQSIQIRSLLQSRINANKITPPIQKVKGYSVESSKFREFKTYIYIYIYSEQRVQNSKSSKFKEFKIQRVQNSKSSTFEEFNIWRGQHLKSSKFEEFKIRRVQRVQKSYTSIFPLAHGSTRQHMDLLDRTCDKF